jgi:hypothetical protein
MNKEITLSLEERRTLCRLLYSELHNDLQNEDNKELMKGVTWKEEHQKLVDYKFRLLNKLGNTYSLSDIKIYNLE